MPGYFIACSRNQRKTCEQCRSRPGVKLCDYPVTRNGKPGTCARSLCARCAVPIAREVDYCRVHSDMAKMLAAEAASEPNSSE